MSEIVSENLTLCSFLKENAGLMNLDHYIKLFEKLKEISSEPNRYKEAYNGSEQVDQTNNNMGGALQILQMNKMRDYGINDGLVNTIYTIIQRLEVKFTRQATDTVISFMTNKLPLPERQRSASGKFVQPKIFMSSPFATRMRIRRVGPSYDRTASRVKIKSDKPDIQDDNKMKIKIDDYMTNRQYQDVCILVSMILRSGSKSIAWYAIESLINEKNNATENNQHGQCYQALRKFYVDEENISLFTEDQRRKILESITNLGREIVLPDVYKEIENAAQNSQESRNALNLKRKDVSFLFSILDYQQFQTLMTIFDPKNPSYLSISLRQLIILLINNHDHILKLREYFKKIPHEEMIDDMTQIQYFLELKYQIFILIERITGDEKESQHDLNFTLITAADKDLTSDQRKEAIMDVINNKPLTGKGANQVTELLHKARYEIEEIDHLTPLIIASDYITIAKIQAILVQDKKFDQLRVIKRLLLHDKDCAPDEYILEKIHKKPNSSELCYGPQAIDNLLSVSYIRDLDIREDKDDDDDE